MSEIESLKADNELLKFKVQAAEQLVVHEKLIRELAFYTSIVKFVLALFGIGSFGAAIFFARNFWPSVKSHIDTDVAAQMQKWSDLEAGFSLIRESRWLDALDQLTRVYKTRVLKNSVNSEYRSSVFSALVWTLASTSELANSQAWKGEETWDYLGRDPAFQLEFMNRARDRWDEGYCNEMFLCTLKFGGRSTSLETVREYLKTALDKAPVRTSKADHEFELAMESLAAHHSEDVKSYLEQASRDDPSRFEDLPDALSKFKDEATFTMWCTYTTGLNKVDVGSSAKDFATEFEDLITQLSEKRKSEVQ